MWRGKMAFVVMALGLVTAMVAACSTPTSSAATSLGGTNWTVVSINGKPPVADSMVTIGFGDDGRANGTAGCNRYFGSYTVNGHKLSFGPVGATKMFCGQPGVMEQENQFTQALGQAESFKVSGGHLEITANGGQIALVFAQA